ncbi:MAG: RNA polymerase sigma factor [Myxococcota bacterium]
MTETNLAGTRARQAAPDSPLTDEEVVQRVLGGDSALYEILMRRHNQRLYRAVRSILRDEAEVEDVLQDAYLSAYRNLAEFEGRARFSTWLTRIAVNRALDRRRRRAKVVALDSRDPEVPMDRDRERVWGTRTEDPERQSARRELGHLLEGAIDELPDRYRGVYILREVEGLSVQETAATLDVEPNTVKTRLHRARGLLRERLVRDFDGAKADAFPFGAERCDRVVAAVLEALPLESK